MFHIVDWQWISISTTTDPGSSHDMCPDPTDPEINTQNKAKLSMKQRQKDSPTKRQTFKQSHRLSDILSRHRNTKTNRKGDGQTHRELKIGD